MVTIKEIASNLGLSHSVVSRALNPKPDANARVSNDTKALVEAEAKRLGYKRNRSAEFMRRGRSAAIGVFLPKYSNSHIADLVMGISEAASERGFPLTLSFGLTLESYDSFFRANIANPSSGIISYPSAIDGDQGIERLFESYIESGGKALLLNARGRRGVPVLGMDDAYGARLAAERLASWNCGSFFVVGEYDGRDLPFVAEIAARGGKCAKLALDDVAGVIAGLGEGAFPVGLFAVTDELALRVVNLSRNAGFQIGDEVMVVGYDNLHLTDLFEPPLTTIHQPFKEQGRRAVEKLLNLIYGGYEDDELLRPRLVPRKSG